MLKEYYDKLPPILKNKFILVTLILIVWVAFFDSNNWIKQAKLKSEIEDLKEQKNYYQDEIEKDSVALFDLTNNKETQEKFAREKFLMKKDNEDIYIIRKKNELSI